jgi:DNA-binding winged helix-turn-helix (wHTH) protein
VWKLDGETGTNIVDVYINYLRRKLDAGEASGRGKLIETVRGTGYRIGGWPEKSRSALRQAFAKGAPGPVIGSALPSILC